MSEQISSIAYRNFVDTCRSALTRKIYIKSLQYYMRYLRLADDDYDKLLHEDTKIPQTNICDYISYLRKQKDMAPKSISRYVSAVRKFYVMNDIQLNWEKIHSFEPEDERRAEDRPYTHSEISIMLEKTTPRNRAIILLMISGELLSLEQIKSLARQWNNQHCSPPLDDREFDKQWKCATDFTAKNKKQNHKKKNDDDQDEDDSTKYTAYKYSKGIPLAEEILLGYQSVFLQVIDVEPITKSTIELWDKNVVIKPHEASEISPVLPYAFKDIEEVKYFVEQAKKETIDSLFFKSKSLWKKFVVTKDEDTIVLLAADQTYTYFQDKFPTTHYDVATGAPGSGKGAMLVTFKLLGYRTVLASDMSGANLLDILGYVELGQVTIAEDELDDIDRDELKRKIYKIGYDNTGQTTRTLDGSLSTRTNRWYYTYSFKIFAAEQPPDSKGLEGFNDRTFRIESIKGNPRFLVKTILNEMQKSHDKQNPKYREIISKIDYLRKLLLVYRLLHYEDVIEEVETNIDGRVLELTSPQIYLFYSDKLASPDRKARKEVLDALSKVLQRKGELAKKALEGVIYGALTKELFSTAAPEPILDINGDNRTKYTLTYEEICNKIRDTGRRKHRRTIILLY